MEHYDIQQLDEVTLEGLCERNAARFDDVIPVTQNILDAVKADGDSAVRSLTKKYDGVDLYSFVVTKQEVDEACANLEPSVDQAFRQAAENIKKFHQSQLVGRRTVETMPGVTCFAEMRPIEKVGLYIPGGTAPLASTVLMLGIPAKLAGCKDIVLTTPPNKDGQVPDIILLAASICGITDIRKIGGAQAIAALAYGTESVPKVDKIFGPGNDIVTAAKTMVSNDPNGAAIDMPAGPTEVFVIADKDSRADFVASDLLSQAEHDKSSKVVLACTDQQKTEELMKEVEAQLDELPRREIASAALQNSFTLTVESIDQAIDFSNMFAPEHLILNFEDAEKYIGRIVNAGSVFIGPYSCESAGDYASGTNHCLPTHGYARSFAGVSVASFQKQVTFQHVTNQGAKALAPVVTLMAEQESLEGHKRAMEIRVSDD